MLLLDQITSPRRLPVPPEGKLPETRPSLLDPCLCCEPWIDACRGSQLMALYLLNRPIALLPGSSLDLVPLNMQLDRLRHRLPRHYQA